MAQNPYLLMGRKPVNFDSNIPLDMSMETGGQVMPAPMPLQQLQAQPTQQFINEQSANAPAPIPQDMSIEQQLQEAYQQQQAAQNEAIKSAEEQLAAAKSKPQQLDLSPLINLASQWSGTNLGAGYVRPTDKSKEIQALQEAVLKSRGSASESARQALKDRLYAQLQQEQIKKSREESAFRKEEAKAVKEAKADDKGIKLQLEVGKNYDKDYGEGIAGLTEVVDSAQKARSIINEVGGIPSDPSDPRTALYKRAVSSIITGYNRDVAKLGALAGADKKLLEAAASNDPNILEAYILNTVGASKGQTAVLDSLIDAADKKMKENESRVKQRFQGLANPMFETQKNMYQQARGIQSSSSKPQTVIQNGVTYTLNPQTGEYE